MNEIRRSWLRSHPALALLGINAAIFLTVALLAEIGLRLYVPYNPGYYVSVEGTSREVIYPYGTIKINSYGYPDDEFDLSKPNHVGYFGDSVTYGVGAGYGYRFTELLADAYPEDEHMNFAGIGLSVTRKDVTHIAELAKKFDLETVIYFFNLNDIIPDEVAAGKEESAVAEVRSTLIDRLDWLRGRSYLYTYLRTVAKNALEAYGIGFHGYTSYEFYPRREHEVLRQTAVRINELGAALEKEGVRFIVVLLPYEMQISEQAAEVYASDGIKWEDDFIRGGTQQLMMHYLSPDFRHIDLLPAFVDPDDVQGSRRRNAVGEYFVFDKGDKLDWNHPNRAGHRKIAEYLERVQLLGPPTGKKAS